MSVYFKCLSRFFIFFSAMFFVVILFIESHVGFKWIFNLTNRIFLGLETKEISGNWHNFTLKDINYNVSGVFIKADSLHVVLDIKSFLKMSPVIKNIETNNLMVSLKKNMSNNSVKKEITHKFLKNKKNFTWLVFLKNIYMNKVLIKTNTSKIFLSDVLTRIKLSNNSLTIFPTKIKSFQIKLLNFSFKKSYKKNNIVNINNSFNKKTVESFFSTLFDKKSIFFPKNINLLFLKCKTINILNYQNFHFFNVYIQAKIKNTLLKIKNFSANSNLFKVDSYGDCIFNQNHLSSCVLHNKIFMPKFYNQSMNILLKAYLSEKLMFQLISKNLYHSNLNGIIFINSLNHLFFIKLTSNRLFFPTRKNFILNLKYFKAIVQGNLNNYSILIKNSININNIPPVNVNIHARGNLKNIYLKKINFFPMKTTTFRKNLVNFQKNIMYDQYLLKIFGNMNILGGFKHKKYNLHIPKINLNGSIMKKKLSILGSLSYKDFNSLQIPEMNFFLGKNKLSVKGFISKNFNINSFLYANHLNDFIPSLSGKIKSKLNIYGNRYSPIIITNNTIGNNLNINNMNLNSLKMTTNMNIKNKFSGELLLCLKKMHFSNFYIQRLYLKSYLDGKKQNLSVSLNTNSVSLNVKIKGMFNYQTGNWNGVFEKINIKAFFGNIVIKNTPFFYKNSYHKKNYNYKKYLIKKSTFTSFLHKKNVFFSKILKNFFVNFKTKLLINGNLQWMFGKNNFNGNVLLTANDTKLKRKIKEKIVSEDINLIELSINKADNSLNTQWKIRKKNNLLSEGSISGNLNILDIHNKKDIEGKFNISGFPMSIFNLLLSDFFIEKGLFTSHIKFLGNIYQPKVSADVRFQDFIVKSDSILKYISLFFPYFSKIGELKINQEIIVSCGNISFILNTFLKKYNSTEWNVLFNSEKIFLSIFPKIKIKFSSKLNLHYLCSKYDVIGYIKFFLFYFKINEKNFSFI